MKKHKGEIVEIAIRNSGYSLHQVAKRMSISRSTLYNRFQEMNISDDFILKLSKVIHHDFSSQLPHLKEDRQLKEVQEQSSVYQSSKYHYQELLTLQKKYCRLLEVHTKLLKLAIKITNMESADFINLRKEIIDFIENTAN